MLSIGLKLQHHCLNGLLPLLVAVLTMPQAENPNRVPLSYGAAIAASSLSRNSAETLVYFSGNGTVSRVVLWIVECRNA
jgi:hypothetical protein